MFDDQTNDILGRISPHNLERMRMACEADGDSELADIIARTLAHHRQLSDVKASSARR